jgi:hypothetical protein
MSFTAAAVTGVLGNMLQDGFDLNDLTPMQAGEKVDFWDREVSFNFSGTLSDAFRNENKFSKYNLLATIMHTRENIPLNTPVEFFVSGAVKEIRIGKKRFRIVNSKYLGSRNSFNV